MMVVLIFAAALVATLAGVKPKDGYVPDGKTAIRLAVAVWEPIYGADQIAHEKPYHANCSRIQYGKWRARCRPALMSWVGLQQH